MFPNNVLQTAPSALRTSLDRLQYVIKLLPLLYIVSSQQKNRQFPHQVNTKMVVVPFLLDRIKQKYQIYLCIIIIKLSPIISYCLSKENHTGAPYSLEPKFYLRLYMLFKTVHHLINVIFAGKQEI